MGAQARAQYQEANRNSMEWPCSAQERPQQKHWLAGHLETPSLGLSLMKACLANMRHTVQVRYFSLLFVQQISYNAYRGITDRASNFSSSQEVCDWLFAEALFGLLPESSQSWLARVLFWCCPLVVAVCGRRTP